MKALPRLGRNHGHPRACAEGGARALSGLPRRGLTDEMAIFAGAQGRRPAVPHGCRTVDGPPTRPIPPAFSKGIDDMRKTH